jgi:hypothetical protein
MSNVRPHMTKTEHRVALFIFSLAGVGGGLLVAHLSHAASWLDAKLYIAAGAVVGVLLAKVVGAILK